MIPDAIYKVMESHGTLLDRTRADSLYDLAVAAPPGEFWECGVYRGGSAYAIVKAKEAKGIFRQVRLFDTFTGFPEPDESIDTRKAGDQRASVPDVFQILFESQGLIVVHEGIVPLTFEGLEWSAIALAHLDMELYRPTKAALKFIWPRLVPKGLIVLDDYGSDGCPAVTRAADEFFVELGVGLEVGKMQAWAVKPMPVLRSGVAVQAEAS